MHSYSNIFDWKNLVVWAKYRKHQLGATQQQLNSSNQILNPTTYLTPNITRNLVAVQQMPLSLLHCGKKIRDTQINWRTLSRFPFLLVPNYEKLEHIDKAIFDIPFMILGVFSY